MKISDYQKAEHLYRKMKNYLTVIEVLTDKQTVSIEVDVKYQMSGPREEGIISESFGISLPLELENRVAEFIISESKLLAEKYRKEFEEL